MLRVSAAKRCEQKEIKLTNAEKRVQIIYSNVRHRWQHIVLLTESEVLLLLFAYLCSRYRRAFHFLFKRCLQILDEITSCETRGHSPLSTLSRGISSWATPVTNGTRGAKRPLGPPTTSLKHTNGTAAETTLAHAGGIAKEPLGKRVGREYPWGITIQFFF